jgi:hypothetical protein
MEKSVIGGHASGPEQDPLVQEEEEDSEITYTRETTSTRTGARRSGLEHSYGSEFDQEPRTPSVFQEEALGTNQKSLLHRGQPQAEEQKRTKD